MKLFHVLHPVLSQQRELLGTAGFFEQILRPEQIKIHVKAETEVTASSSSSLIYGKCSFILID